MTKPIVFMFSGQGSQYFQMGRELYQNLPRFRMWMDHCDELVQPLIGRSLIDILYGQGKKAEAFDRVLYTNPALLCFEYSLARLLMDRKLQPDYVLGYSLGEISAAVLAGVMSLEEGIRYVIDFAKLLEAQSPPAGMLAILDSTDIVARYPRHFSTCWISARNFPNHIVVSGGTDAIEGLQNQLIKDNIVCQRLAVNYPFHTELMAPLEESVRRITQGIDFARPRIPIISSYSSNLIDDSSHDHHWGDHLWELARYPVHFERTVNYLLNREQYTFIDVGPSGTLATFIKYLVPAGNQSVYVEVINQYGRDINSLAKLETTLQKDTVSLAH